MRGRLPSWMDGCLYKWLLVRLFGRLADWCLFNFLGVSLARWMIDTCLIALVRDLLIVCLGDLSSLAWLDGCKGGS